mgnify:CR=1 FL=1
MVTQHGEMYGTPFRLTLGDYFVSANAEFSHTSGKRIVFKDSRGNYAQVVGARNPAKWLKEHGYEGEVKFIRKDTK